MGNGGGGHRARSDETPTTLGSGLCRRQEERLGEQGFCAPQPWHVQGERPLPTAVSTGRALSRNPICKARPSHGRRTALLLTGTNSRSGLSFWGVQGLGQLDPARLLIRYSL